MTFDEPLLDRAQYRALRRRLKAARRPGVAADGKWSVISDTLHGPDRSMLRRISRRVVHNLARSGVADAEELLLHSLPTVGPNDHWRWRVRMAEQIAAALDPERFGVAGIYLIGSAKDATAGPASDLDLIVHCRGSAAQRAELGAWLEGWSRCLAELNYLRTGDRSAGILDPHFVTDTDIEKQTSYAARIGAVTDPARPLPLKGASQQGLGAP
jgi:hypothetical protein